ncbi:MULTISPECIES: hypothetical protein [unclassified Exiguobacterium]|nr:MULTISPECIES: hypothetical protein [unclassified Exiguobacterium]
MSSLYRSYAALPTFILFERRDTNKKTRFRTSDLNEQVNSTKPCLIP